MRMQSRGTPRRYPRGGLRGIWGEASGVLRFLHLLVVRRLLVVLRLLLVLVLQSVVLGAASASDERAHARASHARAALTRGPRAFRR